MNICYLGIDIAKAKLDCALLMPDGKCKAKVFKNTREGFGLIKRWLNQHGAIKAWVCMEATGIYGEPVAEYWCDADLTVSVVNPAQLKAFGISRAVRTKTDKVDARLIARDCRAMAPAPWAAPSATERRLRALVARLDALQKMHTQEANRLEVARDNVREGIAQHIAWLNDEIKQVVKAIEQLIKDDPDLKGKRPKSLSASIGIERQRQATTFHGRSCVRSVRRCTCRPWWLP